MRTEAQIRERAATLPPPAAGRTYKTLYAEVQDALSNGEDLNDYLPFVLGEYLLTVHAIAYHLGVDLRDERPNAPVDIPESLRIPIYALR